MDLRTVVWDSSCLILPTKLTSPLVAPLLTERRHPISFNSSILLWSSYSHAIPCQTGGYGIEDLKACYSSHQHPRGHDLVVLLDETPTP